MEPGAPDWTVSISLIAIGEPVANDEVRRYWNVKETPTLDQVLARSAALRLGTTVVPLPDNSNVRGPVGRVLDVLSCRGTTPDYALPLVDDNLRAELVGCIRPLLSDPPFEVVSATDLDAFLTEHEGERLAIRELPSSES